MASRLFRSRRALAGQIDFVHKRLSYLEKHPAPKRLIPHSVTTQKIQQKSVTTPKLAENAVTASIIAANAVTSNAIADNAVTTNAIAANAVTPVELADNSVTANAIAPGAITVDKVGFTAGDIGASTTYLQDDPPASPTVGDLWFDSNNQNLLSQWSGSAWVPVRDLAISAASNAANAANTAAAAANTVAQQAANAANAANAVASNAANVANVANNAANAAQTTANSKNKIIRSTADASGTTGYSAGDLWWKMDSVSATANVIGQWTFDGTKWNSNVLRNEVIGTLDAAKITTGYLAANLIQANSINANKLVAGSITANELAANSVTAYNIVASSITGDRIAGNTIVGANIVGGTITGNKIASNTIDAVSIVSGSITANQMAANSVTATQITATAIDGKVISGATLIGAVIRTSNSVPRTEINTNGLYFYKASSSSAQIFVEPSSTVYAYDGASSSVPTNSPVLVFAHNGGGTYNSWVSTHSLEASATSAYARWTLQSDAYSPNATTAMAIEMQGAEQYMYLYGRAVIMIDDFTTSTYGIVVNGSAAPTGVQQIVGQSGYCYDSLNGTTAYKIGHVIRQVGWYSGTVTSVSGGLPGDMLFTY